MNGLNEVVVAAYGRSAVGRARKGGLAFAHPVDFGAQVLRGVLDRVPALDPADIDDVVVGCSNPSGKQGSNIARQIVLRGRSAGQYSGGDRVPLLLFRSAGDFHRC